MSVDKSDNEVINRIPISKNRSKFWTTITSSISALEIFQKLKKICLAILMLYTNPDKTSG